MNVVVAYKLLNAELAHYRELTYGELSHLVGLPISRLVQRGLISECSPACKAALRQPRTKSWVMQ